MAGRRYDAFRREKNTNWEGAYRVPALIRRPGLIRPHTEIDDIVSAEDWVLTPVAAAGEPYIKSKLLNSYSGPPLRRGSMRPTADEKWSRADYRGRRAPLNNFHVFGVQHARDQVDDLG